MNEFIKGLWDRRAVRYAILALLAAMSLVSVIQGIRNAAQFSQDFQWDAVKTFTMRINPYDESLDPSGILDQYGFDDYYLQMEANQFPSLLMLLIPYTFLPPLTARYAWIISNMIFTAGIIFLLRKTFLKDADRDVFAAFMLLMIAGTPYRNQLGVGQHTLFAFFFFLLAVWFEGMYPGASIKDGNVSKRSPGLFAAVVICLFVCYFKYTLTVPLCLYFIYKRRYAEVAVSAFLHVALTGVSAWWLGDSFVNMLIKPLKVSSALAAEGGLDFGALLKGSPFAYVLAFIVMIGLFILTLKSGSITDKGGTGADQKAAIDGGSIISVLTLWSLIITYHRTYDFFVMVTVLAFFLAKERGIQLKAGYALTLVAVFFVLRVFSESAASKAAVGALYYIFTIAVTAAVLRDLRSQTNNKR